MSRADSGQASADSALGRCGEKPAPNDRAITAEDIGIAALDLARRAHGAGLFTIGYLLESVALEAGAEAAAGRRPADVSGR